MSRGSTSAYPLPDGSSWKEHTYYEAAFSQHWTHSLDEEFEVAVFFPSGSVFLVESIRWRPIYLGGDDEEHNAYVVLKTLDPRVSDGSTLRFGFECDQSASRVPAAHIQIDEPLVILALAGKGLAP